jgi:hypothetical protein
MLRQLRMQNYRCFEDHTVLFERDTVIVGKNNAGKSSLIEALRLVASVTNRKSATFTRTPNWLDLPRFQQGIVPGITQLGLDLRALFHRYREPPAVITATFKEDCVITLYLGNDENLFATIHHDHNWVTTSGKFLSMQLPWLHVLPQISPLLVEERLLSEETVNPQMNSRLLSRHFRNEMHRMPEQFSSFKSLAEETWHGLQINPVQTERAKDGFTLSLHVRDGDFVSEVGMMGHGLQMWLQTIWFLSRTAAGCTVVLDEPDVYMHPDLQRKLYRITRGRYAQSIVATHSVEIMAESDPANILIIDKRKGRSKYANDEPGVQLLIDQIGGIHNVHLARLWSARKFLLLEGKDIALLKHFHAALYPDAELPIDSIPSLPIGGWGGWTYAVASSMTLQNAVGDNIKTYCIFDSDYHLEEEIKNRYNDAKQRGVCLHIWKRKEIENYLLHPRAIRRVLATRIRNGEPPSEHSIAQKILDICDEERRSVEDKSAAALQQNDRSLDIVRANSMARQHVKALWAIESNRPMLVSGKDVLSRLSEWTKTEFGASFGAPAIARQLKKSEIPTEIVEVIRAIEEGSDFPQFDDRSQLN